jgi:large subunit ribosomal protein L1
MSENKTKLTKAESIKKYGKGGKKIRNARAQVNQDNFYQVNEAIKSIKANAPEKFDATVECAIQLGVDPKHSDQMVRGVVSMPHGTGKDVRVAVFARGDKAEAAKAAGADVVGAEDLVEAIKNGEVNFDRCIASPDMMALVGAVAKVLGPKGLMPNPKLGTVTVNVAEAVKVAKSGQVEFRVEKAGIVHAGFGKVSFSAEALHENLKALVAAIIKSKPTGAKGTYVKAATFSSTMGASYRIDIPSLIAN